MDKAALGFMLSGVLIGNWITLGILYLLNIGHKRNMEIKKEEGV